MELKEKINACTDDMLAALARIVKYNSENAPALPGMPYGEENAKVLAEALAIAEEMGFRTKNLDNYCGYAEIGEGKDLLGIAAHLDIVPAGEGWTHDPFKLTIEGDKVYGRGTTDDKGPVILALYAAKLVNEAHGGKLNKRIRVIMGCNEEKGSGCMKHYSQVEEPLTMGFTPDAYYPCIYGEKGHMGLKIYSKNTKIISVNGGFVSNAVCDRCTTVIPAGSVSAAAIEKALADTALVSYEVEEADGKITIKATGVAAHASTPLIGVNAAGCTMAALKAAGFEDDFVDFYNDRIGTACDGSGCGIKFEDDYGNLTFNNGIIKSDENGIMCTIDIRVPVTVTEEMLRKGIAPYLESDKGRIEITGVGGPLFFPKDSDLVKALYGAYVDVTGDTEHEPMVIGGGTYAKALPGIIALGPEFPGKDYRIHNTDEYTEISGMKTSLEIFVKAIENMLAL